MKHFHNTISASGEDLKLLTRKAQGLESLILSIYKEYPKYAFTPYDMQSNILRIYGKDYPVTSVRRALSNLSYGDNPKLFKSEKAEAMGIYKVPNHVWSLRSKEIAA